jgi:hypothetical protein
MRRVWRIGLLGRLWRKAAKEKKTQNALPSFTKNRRRDNEGLEELKEPCLDSPIRAREEESSAASTVEQKPLGVIGPAEKRRLCIICGKPSDEMICGACADKIGADAVEKKRSEEKGKP